jgi:hypothetical protein
MSVTRRRTRPGFVARSRDFATTAARESARGRCALAWNGAGRSRLTGGRALPSARCSPSHAEDEARLRRSPFRS